MSASFLGCLLAKITAKFFKTCLQKKKTVILNFNQTKMKAMLDLSLRLSSHVLRLDADEFAAEILNE